MHQSLSLSTAYNQFRDLIPDYQWTTIIKNDDLHHIPTNTILSCDINGYYMTVNGGSIPIWDYEMDEYVLFTPLPMTAAIAFVMHVIKETIQARLEAI